MNRKLLRKVIGVSAAAVMIGSLAGCGSKGEGQQETVAADEGPMGAYKETVICNMGRKTIANPRLPEGNSYEDNAYTRYLKEKLNIEVKDTFEANDGVDYDRQVSLAIASGELPDIMRVNTKDVLDELMENELIEDLTDIYDTYATDYIKNLYNSYDGRCLETATYDGRLMALPGTNSDDAPCQVFIRQDWLDALGMTIDGDGDGCLTLDELEGVAKTFIEKDPGNSGNPVGMAFSPNLTAGNYYSGTTHTMTAIGSAYQAFPGTWLKDEAGDVYNGSVSDGMKETIKKLAEWYEKGILDPQFGTRISDDITALLTNGQMGIVFGPWHVPDWLLNNVRGMDSEAQFSAFTICDENGKVNVVHSNASNGYMVVRKGYSNPEVLVKMANLYFDEVVNNKNLDQEKPEISEYITTVDNSTKPFQVEIEDYANLLNVYSDMSRYLDGEITLEEVRNAEPKTTVMAIKGYLDNPEHRDITGWSKYTSRLGGLGLIHKLTENNQFEWFTPVFFDVTETMKTNKADLDKLQEETFVAMITGSKSIDEFDDFVGEWKTRGGETITKEVQEKVDNR